MAEFVSHFEQQPQIKVPLLIVQGTNDHVVDWAYNTKAIQKRFPDSQLSMIEGAMHHLLNEAMPWQQTIYACVTQFLRARG